MAAAINCLRVLFEIMVIPLWLGVFGDTRYSFLPLQARDLGEYWGQLPEAELILINDFAFVRRLYQAG
ncbi:MAG: hypothetical protein NTY41_01765, partial [Proteobacteria bacterium]|nr:hypothetical protein [Pseudomonadota bacterium]